jgi:ParB/RepB/Spo0J family partition protein
MTDALAAADPHSQAPIQFLQLAAIIVPEERQRKMAKADATLIESIRARGVLSPLIIREGNILVAGERRLDACRELKLSTVPVRNLEQLPLIEAFLIELQENLARKQLTWQEEAAAILSYHLLRRGEFPGWTQLGTANDLGLSEATISRALTVAAELDDPAISGCVTIQAALNFIQQRAARTIAAAKAQGHEFIDAVGKAFDPLAKPDRESLTAALVAEASGAAPATAATLGVPLLEAARQAGEFLKQRKESAPAEHLPASQIINAEFGAWAATYDGIPFDVIHCDFPYGKGYAGANTSQQAEHSQPIYDDREDVLWQLLYKFFEHQERLCAPQAHCLFWFDMRHYSKIITLFGENDWRLSAPHPLIWTKGNAGAPGDIRRAYRHCYENALLFSRGDRSIVKMVQDHFACPLDEDKLHLSQKPVPMLRHFLSGVCDENTRLLDPTCGSGSSIAAANQLQLDYAIGIELDPHNAEIARFIVDRKAGEGNG